MSRLRLILGDQLNVKHSWFREPERSASGDVIYVLMEVRSETDYVVHHAQKVLGIFAAMRGFSNALQAAGFRVHYIRLSDADNQQDFIGNLRQLINRFGITRIERQQAVNIGWNHFCWRHRNSWVYLCALLIANIF